ncbi:MAG: AAA family ATPase [Bacillaceae bacterium]|nr:AAA family ATPase [Bacillaceae bacterium]
MPSDEQLVTDLMKMVGYYEQYIKMQKEKETNDIFERYLKEFIESRSSKDQIKFLFSNLRDRLHLINDGGKIDRQNLEYDIDQLLCDLPFVETDKSDHQLKLFTTLDLPRPTYSNMMQMLKDLLNGKYKASDIQKVFKEEKLQTLYKRSRQGLRLLQYLDDKNELTIDTFPSKYEQRSRVKELAVFKMVLQVLNHTNKLSLEERKELLKHVLKMTVISSTTETPIKDSVRDYRLNNVIGWLKALDIIDDNLKIKHEDVGEDANTSRRNDEIHEPFYKFENETDLITHIHSYIQSQGFYYKKEDLKNFYLSLKTKPFVILSGISGTGKSKIVEKFANSVGATRKNGRFRLIPVRPDWSDGSDLIGYVDIKGEFQPGPLTKVLEQAMNDPGHPYFILLDEMNLARVEYYFSDLLSVMESREWDNGQIVTSTVIEREDLESPIIIPENVYVAGTVNMDETTHPFSPKVLDRANTIEFNDVELMNFDFGGSYQVEPVTLHNDRMRSKFLTIKDALRDHEDIVKATTEKLVEINRILEKNNKHFGYRVRDEICFYMIYNDQAQLMSEDEAFDYQLMQKILPKLSGNDHHTADIIHELFVYCTGHEMDLDNVDERIQHAKYPKSARKLTNMYQHQVHNGFTSFWL